jgi:RNA polymerase sigma factor (sigma-70 family)
MHEWQHIDTDTWTSFQKGDKVAYATIYQIYYPRLYTYGCNFTPNAQLVEDCVQEIFIHFWMNREKLGSVQSIQSYLFVSFRNKLTKSLQQQASRTSWLTGREQVFELDICADQVMINAERMYEQQIQLHKAVQQLSHRQKEAVFLKFYQNLSYEEIAGVLGISTKATYKLVARAIAELRKTYRKQLEMLLTIAIALMVLYPPAVPMGRVFTFLHFVLPIFRP